MGFEMRVKKARRGGLGGIIGDNGWEVGIRGGGGR